MKNNSTTKSGIDKKIQEVKKLREGYAGKVLAWGEADTEKWYETQLELILSKELSLAEERGREEAIEKMSDKLYRLHRMESECLECNEREEVIEQLRIALKKENL